MAKIWVAIPSWEADEGKRKVLQDCVASLKGMDSVLILHGKQPTLPRAWNMCLELAFGMGADFVVLSNDDIILDRGTLDMLCMENAVVSPMVNNGVFKVFHAHIFAIPRAIWEKIGPFDERFEIYWADTDYAKRLKDAGVDVHINTEVNVKHPEGARTLKHYKGTTEKSDEQLFKEKWGRTWFDPITGV